MIVFVNCAFTELQIKILLRKCRNTDLIGYSLGDLLLRAFSDKVFNKEIKSKPSLKRK